MARLTAPAYRVWTQGLMHAQEYRTDGFIATEDLEGLGRPVPREDWVAELIVARLWEEVDGGYLIHDYLQWNDPSAKRAEKAAKNREGVALWRARQKALRVAANPPPSTPEPAPPPRVEPPPNLSIPPTGSRRGNGLIQNSFDYERRKAQLGYFGARFQVPKTLHQDLIGRYGGDESVAEAALQAWYQQLEARLGADESIPNIYAFINGHFAKLVESRAAAVPVVKVAKKADDPRPGITPEWRAQLDAAQARKYGQSGE